MDTKFKNHVNFKEAAFWKSFLRVFFLFFVMQLIYRFALSISLIGSIPLSAFLSLLFLTILAFLPFGLIFSFFVTYFIEKRLINENPKKVFTSGFLRLCLIISAIQLYLGAVCFLIGAEEGLIVFSVIINILIPVPIVFVWFYLSILWMYKSKFKNDIPICFPDKLKNINDGDEVKIDADIENRVNTDDPIFWKSFLRVFLLFCMTKLAYGLFLIGILKSGTPWDRMFLMLITSALISLPVAAVSSFIVTYFIERRLISENPKKVFTVELATISLVFIVAELFFNSDQLFYGAAPGSVYSVSVMFFIAPMFIIFIWLYLSTLWLYKKRVQ